MIEKIGNNESNNNIGKDTIVDKVTSEMKAQNTEPQKSEIPLLPESQPIISEVEKETLLEEFDYYDTSPCSSLASEGYRYYFIWKITSIKGLSRLSQTDY